MASLSSIARRVASKGRNGDSTLLHISKAELAQLEASGKITKNPKTGLPEAFGFGGFGRALSNFARGTAGLFSGGTSGANVAQGQAPTTATVLADAAGLGAGAGAAGALGAGAAGATGAGGAAGTGASGFGVLPALTAGASVLSAGTNLLSAVNTKKALGKALPETGPQVEKATPMPTFGDQATQTLLKSALLEQSRRRGRASTILTSESLGA